MNYSYYLYKIIYLLKCMGWRVEEYAIDLPVDVYGRTYYSAKLIKLDCLNVEKALIVLAHEAGHVIAYNRRMLKQSIGNRKEPAKEHREKQAYLIGWCLLKYINCPLISKSQWRELHPDYSKE